ncbi:MAG: LysE family translocator [Candidatus Accumulibacter sp.]|jgi:threonine/homoserine/homoserine lactone efflux protein|nr:LysE family translocator [Accumulibacter sp.]
MSAQEFTALLALATAMSFTPGPNTTLATALAANGGMPGALRFVCAVPVGWGALLALCAAGVGALVTALPALKWAIQAAGAGYLLWLAWRLVGSAELARIEARGIEVGFWQGVALQFVNIKVWLLALTVVAGWIAGRPDAVSRLAVAEPVLLTLAFSSNLLYAGMGALLRGWLARGRRLLWFNRVMGAVLVVTAAWMLMV